MESSSEILVLGTGTAGARAAYYLYQRGTLDVRIVAVDSDAEQLAMLPTLPSVQVPPPPALPVGQLAENAREALRLGLEESFSHARMLLIVTCLGGDTGDFYTQAALLYAQSRGLPAVTIAAMPHSSDAEEIRAGASQTLDILRAQHFEVQTLDCGRFGAFFPDDAPEHAYAQAVRWIAETAIGYLLLFTLPRHSSARKSAQDARKQNAMNFDEMPRGIFAGTYPTFLDKQNLDIPTYLRQNLEITTDKN